MIINVKNLITIKNFPLQYGFKNEHLKYSKKLIENFEWNKLVYASDYKFEPEKGKVYFLYQKEDETLFLSLIEPEMWDKIFIGAFKLDSENKWIKLEKVQ